MTGHERRSSGTTPCSATIEWPALAEVIEARVWGGVHYRAADVEGARIGDAVAHYVLAREFRPRH